MFNEKTLISIYSPSSLT